MSDLRTAMMLPTDMQLSNEYYYSRKQIDRYIDRVIKDDPELEAMVHRGVVLLEDWVSGDYYESKTERLAQLNELMFEPLVRDVFIAIAYCREEEQFVNVTARLASRLDFDQKQDAIQTTAEIVAVLCQTDAYDIIKHSKYSPLTILSKIPLPDGLWRAIDRSQYLPPMVCEPKDLTNNFESPYLTHNDCRILGKHNSHDGDVCLDVINKQNQTALSLDLDFLKTVIEEKSTKLTTPEQIRQWEQFVQQSQEFYILLAKQGNQFWLDHKVDKRGRLYAQGYHINPQGTPYKKAMLETAHKERVEGVPD